MRWRSALDAVAACRQRCWEDDWVIDLDIRKFFDTRQAGQGWSALFNSVTEDRL
jgi:RNA-directed DNA polymerase